MLLVERRLKRRLDKRRCFFKTFAFFFFFGSGDRSQLVGTTVRQPHQSLARIGSYGGQDLSPAGLRSAGQPFTAPELWSSCLGGFRRY
jgi:hypothetical protein